MHLLAPWPWPSRLQYEQSMSTIYKWLSLRYSVNGLRQYLYIFNILKKQTKTQNKPTQFPAGSHIVFSTCSFPFLASCSALHSASPSSAQPNSPSRLITGKLPPYCSVYTPFCITLSICCLPVHRPVTAASYSEVKIQPMDSFIKTRLGLSSILC